MNISFEKPSAEDYVDLRIRSGMGDKDIQRSRTALENSLFTVSLYDGKKLIGFGRVAGDRGITFIVSDIMVDKNFQRQGLGDKIMKNIDQYLEENTFDDSFVCLIANHPADLLYCKYRFDYLPDNRTGMMRRQSINKLH